MAFRYYALANEVRLASPNGVDSLVCTVDPAHDAAWIASAISERVERQAKRACRFCKRPLNEVHMSLDGKMCCSEDCAIAAYEGGKD
jgi:hypothetical protein